MKNSLISRVMVSALALAVWMVAPATAVPNYAAAKGVAAVALDDFKAAAVALWVAVVASYTVRMAPYAQAFQSVIGTQLALGVIGEFWLDAGGSSRVQPGVLKGTAANIVIGRWFTRDPADGLFLPGGDAGVPGGILMNPKEYSTAGTAAGGALAPTLTLLAGTVGSFCTDTPGIVVRLGNAAAVGAGVYYDDVTGELFAGVAGAGQTQIPNAAVVRFANLAAGLAVVSLIGN
jgi:hypothetical protein